MSRMKKKKQQLSSKQRSKNLEIAVTIWDNREMYVNYLFHEMLKALNQLNP